jgi:hypothetical protein
VRDLHGLAPPHLDTNRGNEDHGLDRKSDHGDAVILAGILRTDLHARRPLPADSELAEATAVLA